MINLPTLTELNNLSSCKNVLTLLRVLNTSDLSFMYDCFEKSTIKDIVQTCEELLVIQGEDTDLTGEELEECQQYLLDMME